MPGKKGPESGMLWWNEQDQAGEGRRGHVQHKPGIPLEAPSSSSSAPSPHASPAAGLVDLSQAATPTKGDLQMVGRIWNCFILMFAASIPLGDSFFGVWSEVSLSLGSPDSFPSVAGQEVTPMSKEGAGDLCMAGDHSPAASLRNGLQRTLGALPSLLGTHCCLPTRP